MQAQASGCHRTLIPQKVLLDILERVREQDGSAETPKSALVQPLKDLANATPGYGTPEIT